MSKTALGAVGEDIACEYLTRKGYKILQRNYRLRFAEIDIVAEIPGYVVFVEVKLRRTLLYGYPCEAVTAQKQRKIRKAAEMYIANHIPSTEGRDLRFDVIEILYSNEETIIEHLENAF